MIAVDTNILVHADRMELPLHRQAFTRLRELAEGNVAWALPIFCVGEFVRVVSHPRLFNPPTPAVEAFDQIDALLHSPSVRLLRPGNRFLPLFRQLVDESGVQGNLVFDAQIAALCLEHGATRLLSEDRDFARFPGLEVVRLEK
ncbi:MAG: PIN domain-containing protein [Bradymonadales bacterium]|nr:PIN domain-containing protein [Bradymonadales bacterium]